MPQLFDLGGELPHPPFQHLVGQGGGLEVGRVLVDHGVLRRELPCDDSEFLLIGGADRPLVSVHRGDRLGEQLAVFGATFVQI